MQEFAHEKLDVYQAALDFLAVVDRVIEAAPQGRAHLSDQLDRAATSIVLNIAEGAGEFARAEKARFYRMARRSGTECAAVLDVLRARGRVPALLLTEGREVILRIVAMLTRMCITLTQTQPP